MCRPSPTENTLPSPTDNTPPNQHGKPQQEVTYTLDGKPFTTTDRKQDAADVLRLGGLDPNGYDLRRLRPGQAPDKPYDDDQQVNINDGDEFLSVRHSAQVA